MNDNSSWKLFTYVLLAILFVFIACAIINDIKTNITTSPVERYAQYRSLLLANKLIEQLKSTIVVKIFNLN